MSALDIALTVARARAYLLPGSDYRAIARAVTQRLAEPSGYKDTENIADAFERAFEAVEFSFTEDTVDGSESMGWLS